MLKQNVADKMLAYPNVLDFQIIANRSTAVLLVVYVMTKNLFNNFELLQYVLI